MYKISETPNVFHLPNVIGNTNPPIKFYRRSHYSIVRSNRVRNQLFNFEGLEQGDLEKHMEILTKPYDSHNCSPSPQDSSHDDPKMAKAIKESILHEKAMEKYLRFYASRVIKHNSIEQN